MTHIFLSVVFFITISLTYSLGTNSFSSLTSNPFTSLKKYTIGNGKTLKVGIMSDSQLIEKEDSKNYNFTDNLIRAFQVLKSHKVDTIIFAGDIGENGTDFAHQLFRNIFDKTYEGERKPILNIVMGNHDYWALPRNPSFLQKRFAEIIGEKPFSHKIINGYHFINWGSENGSYDKCNSNQHFFEPQIQNAIKDDPTKPVFVTTHLPPSGTVYGSDNWGNNQMTFLEKYPQVVTISGHSHYALTDERSIWQGAYTAINTQSVSYTELEEGKENGSIPTDEFGSRVPSIKNNMGLIMSLTEDKVEIQRISFSKNEFYKEPWIIDLPIDVNTFRYNTEKRKALSVSPQFIGKNDIRIIQKIIHGQKINQIFFKQAIHDDLVHSYRILFNNGKHITELLYFSDFYLMGEDRGQYIILKLPLTLSGKYDVAIYAIESFGKESEPIIGEVEIF